MRLAQLRTQPEQAVYGSGAARDDVKLPSRHWTRSTRGYLRCRFQVLRFTHRGADRGGGHPDPDPTAVEGMIEVRRQIRCPGQSVSDRAYRRPAEQFVAGDGGQLGEEERNAARASIQIGTKRGVGQRHFGAAPILERSPYPGAPVLV